MPGKRGQDFEINGVSDVVLTIQVNDAAGAAQDVTGVTWQWTLSREEGGAALVTKISGSGVAVASPTNGQVAVTLADTDTTGMEGVYFHQLRSQDASPANLLYPTKGALIINPVT